MYETILIQIDLSINIFEYTIDDIIKSTFVKICDIFSNNPNKYKISYFIKLTQLKIMIFENKINMADRNIQS